MEENNMLAIKVVDNLSKEPCRVVILCQNHKGNTIIN